MLRVASERNAELLCIDGVSYDVSNLLPERPRLHEPSERIRPSQRHWHEPNSMESQAQSVALTPGRIRNRKSISSSHTPSKRIVKPGALRMFEGEVNAKSDCDSFPTMTRGSREGRKQPPPSYQEQRHKLKDPPSNSTSTSTTGSCSSSDRRMSWSPKSPPSIQWGESSCSNMSSSCDMDRKPQYQAHPQHSHQPSAEILTLEIAPGVHKPLRGSRETAEALDLGYIKTSSCFCCTVSVSYVADAAYFLCPTCRVISPAPNSEAHAEFWGVGLGFLLQ